MSAQRLWLGGLVLAGATLAFIALRAQAPTYSAPRHAKPVAVPVALTEAPLPGHVVRTFAVEGICCQGCGTKLHAALADIDGVQELAVDPVLGEVTLSVRADVGVEALERALTFDKYSARVR
ncbi:MAG TPA: heavy-metal-associated domain-containing protein [Planctomycetota bacterium]